MKELLKLTATEQGKGIGLLKICPINLTEVYIEKIKNNPNASKIFSVVMEKTAIKEAIKAKKRAVAGNRLSILDGVPISWKDLFDTRNIPTEAGSKLLHGRIPVSNAQVVKDAKKAGLISIGKTHMTELAFSGLGVNPMSKTPPNSVDSTLAPGGSSSGAAVSVAMRLASGAWGSDTGGSVRVPAAWNNLVGLKTTHGLLSLKGVVPLCPSFDTIGPIVRSVSDASNFLSILIGNKPIDLKKTSLKNKHFGIVETVLCEDLDPNIQRCFENNINRLSSLGVRVSHINTKCISDAMNLSSEIFSPEAYGTWKELIENCPEKMHPPILERFRSGKAVSGPEYVSAWQKLLLLRKSYLKLISSFDIVIAPTTPILPPKTEDLISDHSYFSKKNLLALRNTRLANLMGIPALSLPTKTDFCGFMLMGNPFGEENLLKLGNSLETKLV